MSEDWAKWEGQVINGVFPLRRFLGGSDHSAVFLTECKARELPNAALKLIPAIPTLTEAQLSHWTTAAALSHPHLIRLVETGRCQLGGLQFLFVVMEYAEQTLSQLLPQRALTADELRETLFPILSALAFLHGKHLVQGQLKPENILVVGDQLKLASDTIRPAGESTASIARPSLYDPPEVSDGGFSAAGDMWSLGVTVVEALTQYPPMMSDNRFDTASLPKTFPTMFANIVRQCLNHNPAKRPAVADLEAELKPVPQAPVISTPEPNAVASTSRSNPPVVSHTSQPNSPVPQPLAPPEAFKPEVPSSAAPPQMRRTQHVVIAVLAAALVVSLALWAGLRNNHPPRIPEMSRAAPAESAAPPSATAADSNSAPPAPSRPIAPAPDQPARPVANDLPSVLHEENPDVPRSARSTIRGRIEIAVRVTVDSSGSVTKTDLRNPGPSKYFARLATEAARKWKFAPADNQHPRTWLLKFEFTRGGATGHASDPRT